MDDDPATDILEATYRALCQHGYADLTIKDIADEANRSKATVHYYYDSKENLFTEFLDFLYEQHTEQLATIGGDTPRDRLDALFELVLADEQANPDQEFRTAMLEVKAQAPYDDAIQTRLTRFDEFLFERIQDIIAAGVEAGEFDDDVDPAAVSDFLVTTITGAHTRRVAVDYSTARLSETITRYAEDHLIADEPTEATH
ncbi:TetR/AcrR family transcriptional regulator [Natribaculum luteum]|uniref:TetR/AcrR family transcriptional regulator n=1 Tax=Natribaculum luteum TaxID=1586232 RepID=A0ABD5NTM6_9EURY|nr:TetR/AcrR family transcriptional regulator [Natribaculum luteum]